MQNKNQYIFWSFDEYLLLSLELRGFQNEKCWIKSFYFSVFVPTPIYYPPESSGTRHPMWRTCWFFLSVITGCQQGAIIISLSYLVLQKRVVWVTSQEKVNLSYLDGYYRKTPIYLFHLECLVCLSWYYLLNVKCLLLAFQRNKIYS